MRDDALDQRAPFLDLRDVVNTTDTHQGLLGLAFDPDYASTGVLYVAFVAHDGANTIMRFHVSANPDRVDATSGEVVLSLADRRPDHNLGMLAFGPDGYLYVATGDEGGPSDSFGNAQDLGSLYGKLLRLDVRGEDTYAIPHDPQRALQLVRLRRDECVPGVGCTGCAGCSHLAATQEQLRL